MAIFNKWEQKGKPFIVEKAPAHKCIRNYRIGNHHLATITVIIDGVDVKTHG